MVAPAPAATQVDGARAVGVRTTGISWDPGNGESRSLSRERSLCDQEGRGESGRHLGAGAFP